MHRGWHVWWASVDNAVVTVALFSLKKVAALSRARGLPFSSMKDWHDWKKCVTKQKYYQELNGTNHPSFLTPTKCNFAVLSAWVCTRSKYKWTDSFELQGPKTIQSDVLHRWIGVLTSGYRPKSARNAWELLEDRDWLHLVDCQHRVQYRGFSITLHAHFLFFTLSVGAFRKFSIIGTVFFTLNNTFFFFIHLKNIQLILLSKGLTVWGTHT